jgi:hypothetical protein
MERWSPLPPHLLKQTHDAVPGVGAALLVTITVRPANHFLVDVESNAGDRAPCLLHAVDHCRDVFLEAIFGGLQHDRIVHLSDDPEVCHPAQHDGTAQHVGTVGLAWEIEDRAPGRRIITGRRAIRHRPPFPAEFRHHDFVDECLAMDLLEPLHAARIGHLKPVDEFETAHLGETERRGRPISGHSERHPEYYPLVLPSQRCIDIAGSVEDRQTAVSSERGIRVMRQIIFDHPLVATVSSGDGVFLRLPVENDNHVIRIGSDQTAEPGWYLPNMLGRRVDRASGRGMEHGSQTTIAIILSDRQIN